LIKDFFFKVRASFFRAAKLHQKSEIPNILSEKILKNCLFVTLLIYIN